MPPFFSRWRLQRQSRNDREQQPINYGPIKPGCENYDFTRQIRNSVSDHSQPPQTDPIEITGAEKAETAAVCGQMEKSDSSFCY